MQLHYLLGVVVVSNISDVKVMSSTVAVINYSAITWWVNNYNIWTEQRFKTKPNQTHSELNPSFFKNPDWTRTKIKKIYSAHPYSKCCVYKFSNRWMNRCRYRLRTLCQAWLGKGIKTTDTEYQCCIIWRHFLCVLYVCNLIITRTN